MVPRSEFLQDEGLKEPCCMSKMPFRRANVRHRLHNEIFRLKIDTQSRCEVSDLVKTLEQVFGPQSARLQMRALGRRSCGVNTAAELKRVRLPVHVLPCVPRAFDRVPLRLCRQ